ncbi:hypothetical protein [Streptomyces alanosinicus]|uniref:hypothetical protein n=1 Tax=Streptomyces alanosinicus TaxID=68171 RepID=UPI001E51D4FD|nr:hypothetical protein [Streptomyces alanosinicus]
MLIDEHGLRRSDVLDPKQLAVQTAQPETVVAHLLNGGAPPVDTVSERASARIKTLSNDYLARTGKRMSDLAAEVSLRSGVSEVWARQVCDGKKTPNIELLHHLVGFFGVDGGESFFTASADEALNRVLLSVLAKLDNPGTDPVGALLDRYGVKAADLRQHGSMTRQQLERVLEGVLRSVVPEEGEPK